MRSTIEVHVRARAGFFRWLVDLYAFSVLKENNQLRMHACSFMNMTDVFYMDVRFRVANEVDKTKWNEVVENSASSEIYHLFEWGELLEKTYNFDIFRLVAEAKGAAVGVLPFIHFNNLFGRKIVSLPFSDIGGLCVTNGYHALSVGLIKKLVRVAKELGANLIELRLLQENAKNLLSIGFVEGFRALTYRLNTKMPYNEIWNNYNKKIRHNIRRMNKIGLEVREAQHKSDIYKYYEIYLKRMKDFGTPPAPLLFWKNMWNIFYPKGMMKLIFTMIDGREIAGFIALLFKKKLYFLLNVSLREFWRYYGLNELLFDWYIKYACKNGYELVDFGRTRKGSGVQRFKEKGWGVERIPLNKYYLFLDGKKENRFDVALYREMNLYARAWKAFVPISLTPVLGNLIRKKIGDI